MNKYIGKNIDITEYLIKHADRIREDLSLVHFDTPFISASRKATLVELCIIVSEALHLNMEEVGEVLTEKYINKLLGKTWLDL